MNTPLDVCILAAGVGSRMRSTKPKALQPLAGRPLLAHLLDAVSALDVTAVHVVVGQGAEAVKLAFSDRTDVNWVYQAERLGTGHAMQQVAPHLGDEGKTLILLGDAPLIRAETLQSLAASATDLAVLSVDMDDPFNYGRIIRQGDRVLRIVEEKDASETERSIVEINTGVMSADTRQLKTWLSKLTDDNAQAEYLLTDIVEHANAADCSVSAIKAADPIEVTGINTFSQLSQLERRLQKKLAQELMDQGVHLADPDRLDVRGKLTAGSDVSIDVNVVLEGEVSLGSNVTVGPNCVIKDSVVGDHTVIKANTVMEEAKVGSHCSVGPFARLRPGAVLSDEVGVGNFVEIKKTLLGRGSKASHLAYLGDSTLGEKVNIGAGTITCNYDGVNKFETHIGDGAFIGTNSSLVAPVSIGAESTIGAGSTITKNVEAGVLALGRGKQVSISNWQRPEKVSPDQKKK
jgi:bifunctional UDP-N-acetylglucosamine pyrophosphorylase/glucosamine-1-phosphate N-acetyltransferase